MVKLVIIADDFTGALDTAVQFASDGANTKVIIDRDYKINEINEEVEVLVINAETRHLSVKEAYKVVYGIAAQAVELGIRYILKKTDSALRGNIGCELQAVVDATDRQMHFIPAFPQIGRVTREGIHYVDDIPVHESVFGQDPFEPVKSSDIREIIKEQSQMPVCLISNKDERRSAEPSSISIYDIETEEDIKGVLGRILIDDSPIIMAGCAGLAAVLSKQLKFRAARLNNNLKRNRLVVICGSVNPITISQLDYAEKMGFHRIRLTKEQILNDHYLETEKGKSALSEWLTELSNYQTCIIDSAEEMDDELDSERGWKRQGESQLREIISANIGKIIKAITEEGPESTLMITGGDTLMGFMNQTDVREITPIDEIVSGAVLFTIMVKGRDFQIISKSGGFGNEQILLKIAELVTEEGRGNIVC